MLHVAGVVSVGDAELGQRERLRRVAVVEPVERLPVLVVRVEVGPHPVDVFVARVEVPGPILGHRRRAGRQGAPDHRHRRAGQPGHVAGEWPQAGGGEAGVDRPPLAAPVEKDVHAAKRPPVPDGPVRGVARVPRAVVGGVDVEAAVRLPERADVGAHLLRPEEPVEPQQVLVAVALGDRPRGDDLVPVSGVGRREVQDRPRARRLPALDRLGEVRAPGAEALDQRRVLVQGDAEMAEVGRVAGVAGAEEDIAPLRLQRAGLGPRGGKRQAGPGRGQGRGCAQASVSGFRWHFGGLF